MKVDARPLEGAPADVVRFEFLDEAADLIRRRGGALWIWPGDDRRPYAAAGRPAAHEATWTTYACDGLLVHVDGAVVPPERWVVSTLATQRVLVATWNGIDPSGPFGHLPLVQQAGDAPPELDSGLLAHVRRFLVVPALAWVLAAFWALRFFGVSGGWLAPARTAVIVSPFALGVVMWGRRKLAERREDREFAARLEQGLLQRSR